MTTTKDEDEIGAFTESLSHADHDMRWRLDEVTLTYGYGCTTGDCDKFVPIVTKEADLARRRGRR